MKIEQLIVRHLYASKKLTLAGIGTFLLDPSLALPEETERVAELPPNAIRFEFNRRAGEDEELIRYIMQQTRKIRPLAAADLESYCNLALQFINIGKPLNIEGIGTVVKSQEGDFLFQQGHYVPSRLTETAPESKEKLEESISFESERPKPEGSKRFLLIAGTLLLLTMAAIAIYYGIYLNQSPSENASGNYSDSTNLEKSEIPDTVITQSVPDSLSGPVSSLPDTAGFRIVIKTYSNLIQAEKGLRNLLQAGHPIIRDSIDASHYRLIMSFRRPLTDSSKVRDSLKRFFGGQPYILNDTIR